MWIYPGRANVIFDPCANDSPHSPASPTITYTFVPGGIIDPATAARPRNQHVSCATCGCQIFEYSPRPIEDPRPAHVRERLGPWQPENGTNGSMGLNVALLDVAGEFAGDVLGFKDGQVLAGKKRIGKLQRSAEDRLEEPRYTLKL